jgi:HAD superfamily hydrolase (TIGR01509 family)
VIAPPPAPGERAGIIFDMDGVLCDSEAYIAEAAIQMFRETYGVDLRRELFAPYVGVGEDRFLRGIAEEHGVTATLPRDKDRTYAIYLASIRGRLEALPGALEFVDAVKRAGWRIAVATSADRIKLDGNLREIGLPPERFDAIATAEDVRNKKPDPEIFVLAARRLALAPERCVVIEDAPNGLRAGRAAGCRCLGITSSFEAATLVEAGAEWTCANLGQVPADALK